MTESILEFKTSPTSEILTTVIVSLYNYEKYIVECLDSVVAQTQKNLNLIVVDDHSSDDSLNIVKQWMKVHRDRFSYAHLLQMQVNSGLATVRNTAFALSVTPFVFVLDADNVLLPPCVDRLEHALLESEASFAYSYARKFGTTSGILNMGAWHPRRLRSTNYIDAMVLMRRSTWEMTGGYRKMKVMGWEDYQQWIDLSIRGGWGIQVPEILCSYRVHGASMLHQVTMKPENYELIKDEIEDENLEFFA